MSGTPPDPTIRRLRRRRRGGIFRWAVVACVVAVLVEVGAVTNGFGVPAALGRHGGSGSGPGVDPANPYDVNVTAIRAAIVYGGGVQVFPALQGTDLCPGCPESPRENTNFTPPVAGIWFYFNVTNVGNNISQITSFALSSSGTNPHLFVLVGVLCCYPSYEEEVGNTTFGAEGSDWDSWGFEALAVAAYLPYNGGLGYELYFNATSPS